MVKNKTFLIGYKVFFSLLGFSAVVTEIATIVERGRFNPVNFFSYFTIENNILISAVLLLSALMLAASKKSHLLDALRGLSTAFMLVVGIGFAALLSNVEGLVLTAVPWDNIVLHYIIPVAALIDYLLDRPRYTLAFKQSLVWLLFPIAYLAYSLTRGALTGWYPYPFLDPATGGYGSVALVSSGLLVLSVGIIWAVTKVSGKQAA